MIVGGKFHGTGARVYICCGFVPDFVDVINLEDIGERIWWNKYMTLAAAVEGYYMATAGSGADQAVTEGVRQYFGGDLLTSATEGTTTYGEGVYLKPESADWRYGNGLAPGGGSGEGDSVTIDTWTLQTAGSRSGKFNEDVISTATHIAAGSAIQIDGLWYVIESVTAGSGEADNEVVLNHAAGSGRVDKIEGCYGYTPMAAGETTAAGFTLNETTNVNSDGHMIAFTAGTFDN